MDWGTIGVWAAVIGVALSFLRDLINGSWRLSNRFIEMEARIMKVIGQDKDSQAAVLGRIEAEFENKSRGLEIENRDLRNELHRIETWARDEFVRKSSFEFALGRIEKVLEKLDAKLDAVRDMRTPQPPQ